MRTVIVTSAAICLLAAGFASAETLSEKTGVNSALGVAPTTADFVSEAARSDMFEIQSSKLAAQRATDEATKAFAAKMITDHSKTTDELKPLAKDANITVPAALDATNQKMLDQLAALNDDDFTKQYHSDQVTVHKEAVSLFERYSKGGDNAAIKAFAGKTLPTIQEHLNMARDLNKKSS